MLDLFRLEVDGSANASAHPLGDSQILNRRSSRALGAMAAERPHFVNALVGVSGGQLVPVPGGVLIKDGEEVIGAVGVSGDTSDNDEKAAVAGIEAAGLKAGV